MTDTFCTEALYKQPQKTGNTYRLRGDYRVALLSPKPIHYAESSLSVNNGLQLRIINREFEGTSNHAL